MAQIISPTAIQGWGADLDKSNQTPSGGTGAHWSRAEQQPVKVKVFHSTERPGITPVFGTSTPPRWISGVIRAIGYRFSENRLSHWLLLMFADRVNMVEGVVDDLAQGHVPNVFEEMGWRAGFKYNRAGMIKKILMGGLASASMVTALVIFKRSRRGGTWNQVISNGKVTVRKTRTSTGSIKI